MRRLERIVSTTTALALAAFVGVSAAQQRPAPQPMPDRPADPKAAPQLRIDDRNQAHANTIEGELVNVDTTAKMLTIETEDGKSEKVRYTDSTKIVGAQSGMAGLASEDRSKVMVKFTGSGAERVASEITIEKNKS